jgi:hypothetical protein
MINLENSHAIISKVLSIEAKLIKWCQEKKYSQGDYYSVRITNNGKWAVRYHNDDQKKFGRGKEHILTQEEFLEAMGKVTMPKVIRPKGKVKMVAVIAQSVRDFCAWKIEMKHNPKLKHNTQRKYTYRNKCYICITSVKNAHGYMFDEVTAVNRSYLGSAMTDAEFMKIYNELKIHLKAGGIWFGGNGKYMIGSMPSASSSTAIINTTGSGVQYGF